MRTTESEQDWNWTQISNKNTNSTSKVPHWDFKSARDNGDLQESGFNHYALNTGGQNMGNHTADLNLASILGNDPVL